MHRQQRRRRLFQAGLCLSLPLVGALALFEGDRVAGIGWVYLALIAFLAWALWASVAGRQQLALLEPLTLTAVATAWLLRTALTLFAEPTAVASGEPTLLVGLVGLCALIIAGFVFLHAAAAIRYGLALVGCFTLLTALRGAIDLAQGSSAAAALLQFQFPVYLAMLTVLFYALSRAREAQLDARREARRLRSMAYEDALTGLPNRRWLEGELERQVEIAGRYGRPLSLILFDLDHFKRINDLHGHTGGDEVLRGVARLVTPHLRAGDTFGRWGGEEFLVIAPETDQEQATALAERLRSQIEARPVIQNRKLTATFGVACHLPGFSIEDLFDRADQALYQGKRDGRNRVVAPSVQKPPMGG